MADINSIYTRAYGKSPDLEEITLLQRAFVIGKVLPSLIVKTLIVTAVAIYCLLLDCFHYFAPKPLKSIQGQLAAVTGGGNGIGREICLELARGGCNVACLDLDFDAAQKLCIELRQHGVNANAYQVDVANLDCIVEVKKEINRNMGIVNILVNNAGLMPRSSAQDNDPDSIRRMMDINVMGHFWTTHAFIGDMIEQGYGHIVGVSSMISYFPMGGTISYTTSKYAVRGFMDALNRKCRHENWGIRTLTVLPHLTNTRKELVDFLRQKIPAITLERVRFRTPAEVGRDTVNALRNGSGYVSCPWYCIILGKVLQLLPFEAQNLADEFFMPHVTSKTNHTASQTAENDLK